MFDSNFTKPADMTKAVKGTKAPKSLKTGGMTKSKMVVSPAKALKKGK